MYRDVGSNIKGSHTIKTHKHKKNFNTRQKAIRARGLVPRSKSVPIRLQHLSTKSPVFVSGPGSYDPILNPVIFQREMIVHVYGPGKSGIGGRR